MAKRPFARHSLSGVWSRLGPNSLPPPVRRSVWLFVFLLVGQLLLFGQYGLALAATVLCFLPHADAQAPGLDAERVLAWWQCGALVLLKLRRGVPAQQRSRLTVVRGCYRVLWMTGTQDEPGRHLMREVRLLEHTRR